VGDYWGVTRGRWEWEKRGRGEEYDCRLFYVCMYEKVMMKPIFKNCKRFEKG
jgi:hypothetical protein